MPCQDTSLKSTTLSLNAAAITIRLTNTNRLPASCSERAAQKSVHKVACQPTASVMFRTLSVTIATTLWSSFHSDYFSCMFADIF